MSHLAVRSMPGGGLLLVIVFVAVLGTAIAVTYSTQLSRQLVNDLYGELHERGKIQAEWGRLVLEQSTWTAHNRIEALASERLKMRIPEAADVRLVTP